MGGSRSLEEDFEIFEARVLSWMEKTMYPLPQDPDSMLFPAMIGHMFFLNSKPEETLPPSTCFLSGV